MHLATKHFVHVGLIPFATTAKPREDIGVDANTYQLLDGTVEAPGVAFRWGRIRFRRAGIIDFRVGLGGELFERPALAVSERGRKERVRGDSLFLLR